MQQEVFIWNHISLGVVEVKRDGVVLLRVECVEQQEFAESLADLIRNLGHSAVIFTSR